MCGIIGCNGGENAVSLLVEGLKALEYRGYDSSGISVFAPNGIVTVKAAGRIENIEKKLAKMPFPSNIRCGIGHTRWATHGKPDDINSHPHCTENVSVVHNGIIENYGELREKYEKLGYVFRSQTDTEAIAVMLDYAYIHSHDALEAIRFVESRLVGSFACGIMFADQKEIVYAIRRDSPLIAAKTDMGNFIASDFSAIGKYTDHYYVPDEGEILVMTSDEIKIYGKNGNPVQKKSFSVLQNFGDTEKGDFSHYMLKEIFDTPGAVGKTCEAYVRDGMPCFAHTGLADILTRAKRIFITACGTALNAGKIGKYFFEKLANIPVECDIASEFRYYPPLIEKGDAVILITQSGETADTLAALRLCKQKGIETVAVVNTPNSSAAREADCVLYTRAGTEIAVASTKAYAAQTALLYLTALDVGRKRGLLSDAVVRERTTDLCMRIPERITDILADANTVKHLSARYCCGKNCFFIGRGADYFLAEESALKLKEVSYIHCEAYAAGELKHGTIALIERDSPVIAIASGHVTYDKMIGNIREVKSRGAKVLLVTDRHIGAENDFFDHSYTVACENKDLFPICAAVFFQLFAYYAAILNGKDVDKPRNLAKSVTVE